MAKRGKKNETANDENQQITDEISQSVDSEPKGKKKKKAVRSSKPARRAVSYEKVEYMSPFTRGQDVLIFLSGVVLLALGFFLILQYTEVRQLLFAIPYIGYARLSIGYAVIPVLAGVVMVFFNPRSPLGWLFIILGVAITVVFIFGAVTVVIKGSNVFQFFAMLALPTGGMLLVLLSLYGPRALRF